MEEDYVMIPGSGTKKIIRDVKKEIETAFLDSESWNAWRIPTNPESMYVA